MDKKFTIYTTDYDFEDVKQDMIKFYNDGDEDYEPSDDEVFEQARFESDNWYEDVRCEFKGIKDSFRDIIIIADLGFWNGRHQGAKDIGKQFVNILDGDSECDDFDWYIENDDVKCTAYHHDGHHNFLYRELRRQTDKETVLHLAYEEKLTDELIKKYTKPIGDKIMKKLGWEC